MYTYAHSHEQLCGKYAHNPDSDLYVARQRSSRQMVRVDSRETMQALLKDAENAQRGSEVVIFHVALCAAAQQVCACACACVTVPVPV